MRIVTLASKVVDELRGRCASSKFCYKRQRFFVFAKRCVDKRKRSIYFFAGCFHGMLKIAHTSAVIAMNARERFTARTRVCKCAISHEAFNNINKTLLASHALPCHGAECFGALQGVFALTQHLRKRVLYACTTLKVRTNSAQSIAHSAERIFCQQNICCRGCKRIKHKSNKRQAFIECCIACTLNNMFTCFACKNRLNLIIAAIFVEQHIIGCKLVGNFIVLQKLLNQTLVNFFTHALEKLHSFR